MFTNEAFQIDISSEGGDIIEAIKIGRFARDILARVLVRGIVINPKQGMIEWFLKEYPNKAYAMYYTREMGNGERIKENDLRKCYSACILIFYGAVERKIGNNLDNRRGKKVIPIMGLHSPYFDKKLYSKLNANDAKNKYNELEKLVKDYLTEMGAPNALITRMFESASNEVDLLDADEFAIYYQDKEPFYEEWQIAKCGHHSPESALTNTELEFYRKYDKAVLEEISRLVDSGVSTPIDRIYPQGFSKNEIGRVKDKLDRNFVKVKNCHQIQRYEHQLEMAFGITG